MVRDLCLEREAVADFQALPEDLKHIDRLDHVVKCRV
jgi:hypothetical protein